MDHDNNIIVKETISSPSPSMSFKMVTFTLAGKDYSIDIMKVKEIIKASKFTFVPNSAPFVKGVYNLRGDIISVIDLRKFFNLTFEESKSTLDSLIILQLESLVIAVVVDKIDSVSIIPSSALQPPHPLFADINLKYIKGLIEDNGKIFLLLDVERIFDPEKPLEGDDQKRTDITAPASSSTPDSMNEEVDIGFIIETLARFVSFHATSVNQDWVRNRLKSWKESHNSKNFQLTSAADAESFLSSFHSPYSGAFWSEEYIEIIASFLDPDTQGVFQVWNPGCGRGYETYSLACMLKRLLPDVHLRIIAQDNDLINISIAPSLSVEQKEIPPGPLYEKFLVESVKGRQFSKEIKDSILFEYHDITHEHTLPELDFVVIRDTVSYLTREQQKKLFSVLDEQMKPGALLLAGKNEVPLDQDDWERLAKSGVVMYKKKLSGKQEVLL